jgi:outer membrane protein assembly factor BamB
MGASTVLDGIVYFSTFGRFSQRHLRRVKSGPRGTFGLNARNGDVVWRFHDGHYSPVVADSRRIYIAGKSKIYALISRARLQRIRRWQALAACNRLRRHKARDRCLKKLRRSGKPARRHPAKKKQRH